MVGDCSTKKENYNKTVQFILDIPRLVNELDLSKNSSEKVFSNDSDDSNDDDEDGWEEMEMQNETTNCLFCEESESSVDSCIEHLKIAHKFDIEWVVEKFRMDQASYVQVII